MRKYEKRAILAAILLWMFVNVLLGLMAYRNYREKAELLYLAMEPSDGETLERVSQYLKGSYALQAQDGFALLESLGFTERYPDALKKQFIRDLGQTALVTTAVFGFCAVGIGWIYCRKRLEQNRDMQELCMIMESIQSGTYGIPAESQKDMGLFWEPSMDERFGQLFMGLESLAEQVRLITESSAKEKEETKALVTDLSHQLRTPLMALKASFDILSSKEPGDAEYGEFLARCSAQIERLTELVESLLQISRMETGLIEVKLAPGSLFDTILLAVNRIYPRASEKKMEIILEEFPEEMEHQMVEQDQKWLAEAIINVLENAVKYSDAGTTVRIRVQKMAVSIRLEIEDEGIGVPSSERSRIFQRFYRGSDNKVQKEEGQGIGLYLTRQIIEKHGGTIRVMAAKPRGSRFVIQLPSPGSLTEM